MNYFIVFDFETDSVKPETCNPVQLASITIDPHSLTIIEGSQFCSDMRPTNIDDKDYINKDVRSTLNWHIETQQKPEEEILQRWRDAPPQKEVWNNFVQHINKYNPKNTAKNAPVACGMNIRNFDLIISEKLNEKYKVKRLFHKRDKVDLMDLFYYSLVWDSEVTSISMDNMRKYFGQAETNSHDAGQDVIDESEFVIRYLSFFKNVFNRGKNPYKGCMRK